MIVDNYSQISEEQLQTAEEYIMAIVKEAHPELDLGYGKVLHEVLVRPAAMMTALMLQNESIFRQSSSLLQVTNNPDLATDEIVDNLMSNYRIERSEGTEAAGNVTIVATQNNSMSIPEGYTVTANGVEFETLLTHSIFSSSDMVTQDSDRYWVLRDDGAYQFTVPVQATTVGPNGKLRRNDDVEVVSPPLDFVQAYAEEDFSGGEAAETNEDLVAKTSEGIAAKILSGRDHIEALLKETLPSLQQVSVIGFGDPEMIRDRHNLMNMSCGGCVDCYARTEDFPTVKDSTQTATLIDVTAGTWQIAFDRSTYPGLYNIEYVRPVNGTTVGTLPILSQTKGLDLTSEGAPDLENIIEGAFSAYQTMVLRFTDTDVSGLSNQDTRDYKVGVSYMANVDLLQEFVNDRGTQNPNGSYLIRAVVPCQVTVNMVVNRFRTDPVIDTNVLKEAVRDAINGLGFGYGKLEGTLVTGVVDALLPGKAMVDSSSLDMTGNLLKPSGENVFIYSDKMLEIPDLPEECVTSRTAVFTCSTDAISISVQTVETVSI